jgi:hypothetical protein
MSMVLALPCSRLLLMVGTVVALLPAGRARAGVTVVFQRGASSPATMYLEGERMRVENIDKSEHASSVILDAAGKRLIMLDEKGKTYTEMTEQDMKQMRERVEVARAQMQERMKTMPPEQRKRMEEVMAGMGGPNGPGAKPAKPSVLKFERLGQKKTINGFACDMYRVLEDGKPHEEDCISPWSVGLLQKSDLAGLRKFSEEMAKNFGAMAAGSQAGFDRLDKYPGIPVSRVPLEASGARGEEEQIKSVKRGSIEAAKFAVPAGFTKKDLPMGGAGGPGGPGGPGSHGHGAFRPLPPPKP